MIATVIGATLNLGLAAASSAVAPTQSTSAIPNAGGVWGTSAAAVPPTRAPAAVPNMRSTDASRVPPMEPCITMITVNTAQ